jgi:hypothetical protein
LDRLKAHRDYLEGEWQGLQAAPLSMRKAMLVAALIDAYADRLFAAQAEPEDILEFRAGLAASNSALRMVFDLCAQRINGPRLVLEAVQVPIRDYGALSVEDFMVSLYNDHSVQRLRLVLPDGTRTDMLETLGEAVAGLD